MTQRHAWSSTRASWIFLEGSACDLTVAGSSVKPARVALGVHICCSFWLDHWQKRQKASLPLTSKQHTPLQVLTLHSQPKASANWRWICFFHVQIAPVPAPQMIHHPTRAHPFPGCLTVRETSSHGAASAARGSHASGRQEGCWFGAGARESTWCGQWPLSIIEYHRVVMSSVFGRLTVH